MNCLEVKRTQLLSKIKLYIFAPAARSLPWQIITTTEVVVCMSPRRAKYRQNPLRGIEVWLPHYLYRPPLKRPVFMPTYSCDP